MATFLVALFLVVIFLFSLRLWAGRRRRGHIYSAVGDVPPHPVAIILGAGLWPDGSLTPILADRVATAADLYHAGAVRTLLLSGEARPGYSEPQRMQEYALRLGVPQEALVLDEGGVRTYATCYRAREAFGVDRAVVVTQRFHVARALYLCDAMGIDAVAIAADRQGYTARRFVWEAREYLALLLAVWDVHVRRPALE
jgi:SanA protein